MPTRVARWSLLAALLVVGVALMHTLGHPAIGDAGPTPRHASLGHTPMPPHPAPEAAGPAPRYAVGEHTSTPRYAGVTATSTPRYADAIDTSTSRYAGGRGGSTTGGAGRGTAVDCLFAASVPPGVAVAPMLAAVHGPAHRPHGMDPSLMCLAILTALLAIGAAVALSRYRARPARPVATPRSGGRTARAPPAPSLATLSVLRI